MKRGGHKCRPDRQKPIIWLTETDTDEKGKGRAHHNPFRFTGPREVGKWEKGKRTNGSPVPIGGETMAFGNDRMSVAHEGMRRNL